jgi:beta-phosphoglucomutase
MQKALIFDFDGVLGFSDVPRFNILRELCAKRGLDLTDEHFPKMTGKTTQSLLPEFFPETDPAITQEIFEEFRDWKANNVEKIVEPVPTTVNFVKNYQGETWLAIASMNSAATITQLIKHFGIGDAFKAIVTRDEVTHHKPNPEVYLKTAEMLGLPPENCIVIEDTILGATAALNAGMACYVLLNGFNTREEFEGVGIAGFITESSDLEALTTYETIL